MTQAELESITFPGPHGAVNAQLARPSGLAPFPAVLLQEGLAAERRTPRAR